MTKEKGGEQAVEIAFKIAEGIAKVLGTHKKVLEQQYNQMEGETIVALGFALFIETMQRHCFVGFSATINEATPHAKNILDRIE